MRQMGSAARFRSSAPQRRRSTFSRLECATERWALCRLGRVDHEHRVAKTADKLLLLTRPLHELNPRDRNLLRKAERRSVMLAKSGLGGINRPDGEGEALYKSVLEAAEQDVGPAPHYSR